MIIDIPLSAAGQPPAGPVAASCGKWRDCSGKSFWSLCRRRRPTRPDRQGSEPWSCPRC